MNFSQMKTDIIKLSDDDTSILDSTILSWINSGINRINQALQCNIPRLTGGVDEVPAFDERFHESLVLFAAAKYREADSAFNDSGYFLNEFNEMLLLMQRDMKLLPSVQVGKEWIQIVVTDATQFNYPLDMPLGSYLDDVYVYINDVITKSYTLNLSNQELRINPTVTLVVGDKISMKIENNSDLNSPPYQWWTW